MAVPGAFCTHTGAFFGLDIRASSARTREQLGWQPAGPGLIEDLDAGSYG